MTWFPRLMTKEELRKSQDWDHLATKYHDLLEENRRLRDENRNLKFKKKMPELSGKSDLFKKRVQ